MHLAQINLGRLAYDLDDPRLADFMDGIEIINRIAAQSPGFVWKYETAPGGEVEETVEGDPRVVVNMTVWESVEDLRHFTYNTLHKRFYGRRGEWFVPYGAESLAMWWVPEGHEPTLTEGLERLAELRAKGDSDRAFGWNHVRGAQSA